MTRTIECRGLPVEIFTAVSDGSYGPPEHYAIVTINDHYTFFVFEVGDIWAAAYKAADHAIRREKGSLS